MTETILRKDYYFEMSLVGEDKELMTSIINQGIDSRLEAFTNSEFKISTGRLYCWIHTSEMSLLLRRLLELENDNADLLADDIVSIQFDAEGLT